MSNDVLSVIGLFEIGEAYFGNHLLSIEITNTGIRFVWSDSEKPNGEASAFLQGGLKQITLPQIAGFLDAQLNEPRYIEN